MEIRVHGYFQFKYLVPRSSSAGKNVHFKILVYNFALRWDVSHSAEVNENINLGYSQDQGYS